MPAHREGWRRTRSNETTPPGRVERRWADRAALRPVFDSRECRPEFGQELCFQTGPLGVVPRSRFERVEFSLGADGQPRHLPAGAKTFLQTFDNLFPGTCLIRGPAMFSEALFEKCFLPLL